MDDNQLRGSGASRGALPLGEDLLRTAGEIAAFTFGEDSEPNRRRVYHAVEKHGFPAFKLGGTLCARRSTILKWVEAQERAA
jgi:hypothetical protein